MPGWLFLLLVGVVLFLLLKLIGWLLAVLLSHRLNCECSIGKLGFFSINDIKFHRAHGYSLAVKKVWLSSGFVNQDFSKPLVVCVADVRVEVCSSASIQPEPNCSKLHFQRENVLQVSNNVSIFRFLVTLLQYVSSSINSLDIVVMNGLLPECLLHMSFEQLSLDCFRDRENFQIEYLCKVFSGKLLKRSTQESGQPCSLEVSFESKLNVFVDTQEYFLKRLSVNIKAPSVTVSDGFLDLMLNQKQTRLACAEAQHADRLSNFDVALKSVIMPLDISISVQSCSLKFISETTEFHIVSDVKQISFEALSAPSTSSFTQCNMTLNELNVKTGHTMFLRVMQVRADLHDGKSLRLNTDGLTCRLHEDVLTSFCTNKSFVSVLAFFRERNRRRAAITNQNKPFDVRAVVEVSSSLCVLTPKNELLPCLIFSTNFCSFDLIPVDTVISTLRFELSAEMLCCQLVSRLKASAYVYSSCAVSQTNERHIFGTVLFIGAMLVEAQSSVANDSVHSWSAKAGLESVQLELNEQVFAIVDCFLANAVSLFLPRAAAIASKENGSFFGPITLSITVLDGLCCASFLNTVCTASTWSKFRCEHNANLLGISLSDFKLCHFRIVDKQAFDIPLMFLEDSVGCTVEHVKLVAEKQRRDLSVQLSKTVSFCWSANLHMALVYLLEFLRERLRVYPTAHERPKDETAKDSTPLTISVTTDADVVAKAVLSSEHNFSLRIAPLKIRKVSDTVIAKTESLIVDFDNHRILVASTCEFSLKPSSPEVSSVRADHATELAEASNRVVAVYCRALFVSFPFDYDFADAFEDLLTLKKWLKCVHKLPSAPFVTNSPLPPDIFVRIDEFALTIADDPFEVRLRDNYVLLIDEFDESERRLQLLHEKVEELRTTAHMLPRAKIDELYASLRSRNAQIYVQRSRQLYGQQTQLPRDLFKWSCANISAIAVADPSLHGKENVVAQMKALDPDCPPPSTNDGNELRLEDLEYCTLWCRVIEVKFNSWHMRFRDYPQSYISIEDCLVMGTLTGAEAEGNVRAKRDAVICIGEPWPAQTMQKNMPPLKFYYDLHCDASSFRSAYGPCWESCLAMLSVCFDKINKPSSDPSPPLPMWDKIRLLFHGRFNLLSDQLTLIMLASADPYNTTEQLELCWKSLEFGWRNGVLLANGSVDTFIRTASKYDDICLFQLPLLKLLIRMQWICRGNPNDHHSVMPCAPNRVVEYSLNEAHDSFAKFRSQNLNVSLTFDVKQSDDQSIVPKVQLYANTFRWIDTLKATWSAANRPIKRGPLFGNVASKKPQLTKHYKRIQLNICLPRFVIIYHLSVASDSNGLRFEGRNLQLTSAHTQKPAQALSGKDDAAKGLRRRVRADWETSFMTAELSTVELHLLSRDTSSRTIAFSATVQDGTSSFFMSLGRVCYTRNVATLLQREAALTPVDSEDLPPLHHVTLHDVRGAWTSSNRTAFLAIWDGFQKSQLLKRNLSTEALKGLRIGDDITPKKPPRKQQISGSSIQNTPLLASSSRSERLNAPLMLQQLIDEASTNFTAYSEEVSEPPTKQLLGSLLCETDTVLCTEWLIELVNGQVALRGNETGGYVLCTAANAKIVNHIHRPIFRDDQLLGKTTWIGAVTGMQYYATVSSTKVDSPIGSQDGVKWLSRDLIEEHTEPKTKIDAVASHGDSAGGVVPNGDVEAPVQLQRIISRCGCHFYFCHFSENIDPLIEDIPVNLATVDVNDDGLLWAEREDVDCFTLKHTTLNCCTNHLQYSMILDMVNNLLLYVDPLKKEFAENSQRLRFQLKLESVDDLRPRILQLQDEIRQLLLFLRNLEKQLYYLEKQVKQAGRHRNVSQGYEELQRKKAEIEEELPHYKAEISSKAEILAVTISCFKEKLIQKEWLHAAAKLTSEKQTQIARRFEVCFEEAQWRLTETDGQLGIADMKIASFLYTKISRINNSGEHLLEVGYVKISNLLPNSPYKDVLQPQHLNGVTDRTCALRVFCRDMPPVGGISIKEHFEINVVPMTIQMTYAFFSAIMAYFFPDKNIESEDLQDLDRDDVEVGCKTPQASKFEKTGSIRRFFSKREEERTPIALDDIDKMKKRAEKNIMFLNVKIPEVPLQISYKGEKEKSIVDVDSFRLLFPSVEYHDRNWTWLNVALAIKQRSQRILLQQFMKQKLLKGGGGGGKSAQLNPVNLPEEEKAKMLLGAKLLGGTLDKKPK